MIMTYDEPVKWPFANLSVGAGIEDTMQSFYSIFMNIL